MAIETKRVLIVSYMFPPLGGIAVQRSLKFAKYLRDFGWDPMVLTVGDAYSATMDDSLLKEVPEGIQVVRVSDPVSKWIGRMVANPPHTDANSAAGQEPHTLLRSLKGWLKKPLKWLKGLLMVPDEQLVWSIRAAWMGAKLVKRHGITCMFTTSGPHSTHITGLLVKKLTGVKWVADFRDPWTDNMHFHHAGLRKRLEKSIERHVFEWADAVTTVTSSFCDLFAKKYPKESAKLHLIRNGVDPADYPELTAPKRTGKPFTFFYAGILYAKRSPERFLQALSRVLRYHRIEASDICVEFAGVFDYPGQTANSALVRELELESAVHPLGYLSHAQVVRKMQSADALLLIGDRDAQAKQYVPGKLYEYLFAGRPIFGLLGDGEAADIVRAANAGVVVDGTDVDAIANAIVEHVSGRASRFAPDWEEIRQYSRNTQTGELASLLNELTATSHSMRREQTIATSMRG